MGYRTSAPLPAGNPKDAGNSYTSVRCPAPGKCCCPVSAFSLPYSSQGQ
ncbi:hypothetical protein BN165_1040040 [Clostridioides difficile E1]|nr:hypothetical protein BN163_1130042 [Clostridioides difficile T5]CCK94171.1 hypothetical protein BN165_1040040 [Clostridioides difficile E1]